MAQCSLFSYACEISVTCLIIFYLQSVVFEHNILLVKAKYL
jgi:hypothetical protein